MDYHDHFARHGGVHFENIKTPEEINEFVRNLPAGKRDSMFEVLQELSQNGYITILNDHVFADGEGNIGGSDDC